MLWRLIFAAMATPNRSALGMILPPVRRDDVEHPELPAVPEETHTAPDVVQAIMIRIKQAQKQLEQLRLFWQEIRN